MPAAAAGTEPQGARSSIRTASDALSPVYAVSISTVTAGGPRSDLLPHVCPGHSTEQPEATVPAKKKRNSNPGVRVVVLPPQSP